MRGDGSEGDALDEELHADEAADADGGDAAGEQVCVDEVNESLTGLFDNEEQERPRHPRRTRGRAEYPEWWVSKGGT